MRLHYHPASTTSRPVMLFVAENKIPMETTVVDIFAGEQQREPFASLNPSRMVPVLEDDGMVLTESSAILKYLADKIGSAAYPKELKERACVNERMDWFNANLYRDYGYGLVYPQSLPFLGSSACAPCRIGVRSTRPSTDSPALSRARASLPSEPWTSLSSEPHAGDPK